jgi:hypothetical protein
MFFAANGPASAWDEEERRMLRGSPRGLAALLAVIALASAGAPAQSDTDGLVSIAEKTRGLERLGGLFDLYIDRDRGTVWLELPPPGDRGVAAEFLYAEGLVSGLGSNPVGLDRGRLGTTRVVRVRLVGPRVLFEEPNLGFRAMTRDSAERRAVDESFATSVLWGGEIAARSAEGRTLVDITSFLVRDAHGVVSTLADTDQGSFELDPARSAVDLNATLALPANLEFEAVLTFTSDDPGGHVRSTAPHPGAVTLVQHYSFIQLPDADYRPREFDPRTGSIHITFQDYAVPLTEPIEQRWIVRHRLRKVDPSVDRSRAVEPIVYYVDPGIPEPVRGAVIDGARWWETAFDRAGFTGGFRVEMLPDDVHPMDVRYNVIEWVHRSTRGWSHGGGVVDPRTGERVKGHVRLGSLRIRQDILIFEGLAGADGTGRGGPDDPVQLALARIRQLSAHEVGHTLGLAHNFAASTYGRASVMDYPAPWVRVDGSGALDFSQAYATGVGEWDVHAIRYAYSEFPPGIDERRALGRIVREGLERDLLFLTDEDARPAGAAHPLANLWDNGADPVAELAAVLDVRATALARFGEANVATGRPLALLEETLAPVYFYHRYQAEAAAKSVGGLEYSYAVRGDGQPLSRPVPADTQRRALDALLAVLDPSSLDLPDKVIAALVPRPAGHGPNREMFGSRTRPAFDPLGAAATAAGQIAERLLQPERLARMVDFHRRDPAFPGVDEVARTVIDRVFGDGGGEPDRHAEIRRAVQWVVVERMLSLAADTDVSQAVRTHLDAALRDLADRLESDAGVDDVGRAHRSMMRAEIQGYLRNREWQASERWRPMPPPPGSPIGTTACSHD